MGNFKSARFACHATGLDAVQRFKKKNLAVLFRIAMSNQRFRKEETLMRIPFFETDLVAIGSELWRRVIASFVSGGFGFTETGVSLFP